VTVLPQLSLASPVGRLTIFEEDGAITSLVWGGKSTGRPTRPLLSAKRQLVAYFAGTRKNFSLPLAPDGTDGELRVWALMAKIPYGETRTYGDLAAPLGMSPRVVGRACARNPLPIFLPCHRVVGADGSLGGYSGEGGVETKRKLLLLEGALLI
jgi:methylated-DNA-[protein]-cysteine S-methyltransferase